MSESDSEDDSDEKHEQDSAESELWTSPASCVDAHKLEILKNFFLCFHDFFCRTSRGGERSVEIGWFLWQIRSARHSRQVRLKGIFQLS
jgi:hypothetical protein